MEFEGGVGDTSDPGRDKAFATGHSPQPTDALGEDDILIVQADHGNDPTIGHPHHTREMVPLMIHSAHSTPKNIGIRKTLSDVGATAADYFHSKAPENGTSFLPLLLK